MARVANRECLPQKGQGDALPLSELVFEYPARPRQEGRESKNDKRGDSCASSEISPVTRPPTVVPDLIRNPGARGYANTGVTQITARVRSAIANRPPPRFHPLVRPSQGQGHSKRQHVIPLKISCSRSLVAPAFIRLPRRSHGQARSTKMSFRAQPRNLRRSSPNHSLPRQSHLDTRGRRARECQSRVRSGAVPGSAPFS